MVDATRGHVRDGMLVELAAEIVSAYVSNNAVESVDLPGLIRNVYSSLAGIGNPDLDTARPKPAVSVKRSLGDDFLICLEDGKKFKSLKRHLRTKYDMSPEEYREKWNLPADYPMVAPGYSKHRSMLAKKMGLGKGEKA
ncbi:MucR family transcriptional regulator [Hyphomonas johnsonii]|jgi:predicted transcriptional regulator|uniref:Ros/MucR family transcriptional regulator n=1 Tax=Hyphomonas johnsonii MHS-2 TaxID=1280950 RepID=A0A059FTA6_9PROT|nr:MucR family transcriptional regulator [Hyphomonas johnsonii]KCZ93736.1 Ros/MucR family transcriptional regulator [Hyphomonas johnsonii MHS-2]